jgi:NAD(P)-dependent dehydrogenase (short-subunit alcohol dehydrogenase family)
MDCVRLTPHSLKQAVYNVTESASGDTTVKGVLMDLTNFDSVKKAAAEVTAFNTPIDCLFNNAGMLAPFKKIYGYDSQFVA